MWVMSRLFLVWCVLFAAPLCQSVLAQDDIFKITLGLEQKASRDTSSHEPKAVDEAVELSLKADIPAVPKQHILWYLSQKQGRIPVYSSLRGKIQIEVGIAGYLGIKCLF